MRLSQGLLFVFLTFSFFNRALSQPANNNFASAINVNALINNCSANAAYTTVAATADQSKGSCWSNGPNNNVWFSFTATATTFIKVQVKIAGAEGTMQNPFVAIWNSSLTQLACQNYVNATTDIETQYFGLTNGSTYYISVDNYSGYSGTFTLCLSDVVDYDFYQGATDVTSLINTCSTNAAYTTAFATPDQAKGTCWSNGPNNNRWFKFTATATTFIKVQVKVAGAEGTMQNPFVAIWNSSLTQLACQNYVDATTDIETQYFGLTNGSTYYISVDNYSGYSGSFTLCLSDVVDYDFYQGATDVTSLINTCSANAAYTTAFATPDQAKGTCWSNGPNNNRWFKFTATATTFIKVQVKVAGAEGTMQNPFVAIWNSSLTQLACQNYVNATTDIETQYFGLTNGSTYYISVDNYSGYSGTFTLCLSDVVDYDFYQGATDVTSLINTCSANAAYTTAFATPDQSKGTCWSNGPNNNRWFKFTATSTTFIKVQVKVAGVEGTMQNPFVAIWNSSLTQLACQNYVNATTDIETQYFGLTNGSTYYISVDNYSGYSGSFTLCLSDVVDYDFYQGATDVTSLINTCSANAAYTTAFATPDQAKGTCWSNGPNNNRWFKFTATATTFIKVQVKVAGAEGTMQNPFVAIWNSSLTQLACQNYVNATTDIETQYFGLTNGSTYYISVDNYSGYSGTFTLCLSDVVDYDFYQGATDVTSLINTCSANAAYTTAFATPDQAKGTCWSNGPNNNRWFKFTATTTTFIKVQVKVAGAEGTMQNPFVAIWNSSLTQLACQNYVNATTDIETQYFGLTNGSTYYISVDNYSGYSGSFTLCLSDVVDYDFYQGATELTDLNNWCSADAAYTTAFATSDKSKGSCWANGPNNNRWFKFTAITANATIQMKTGGSEGTLQNAFLALWQSNGTTQIACASYVSATSDLSFSVSSLVPGNVYYISCDNYAGYSGTFKLCINNIGTTFYSRLSGPWTDVNTWSTVGYGGVAGASYPNGGDVANIRGNDVTISANQQAAEVNLDVALAGTSLAINTGLLTINGKMTLTNSGNSFPGSVLLQSNGSLYVNDILSFSRSGGDQAFGMTINSGSAVTVNKDLNWSSTGGTTVDNLLTVNGTGTMTVNQDVNLTSTGGRLIKLQFNNSAVFTIKRDVNFTANAASLELIELNNSAQLKIARNFVRGATPYGSLTCNNTSTVECNGVIYLQTLAASAGSGGDSFTYQNVVMNNTHVAVPQITLGGAVTVNGNLTLTAGVVSTTSSNILNLKNASSTTIGSSGSYVDGPMTYEVATSTANTTRNFPLGKSGSYRPAVLIVTHSDNASVVYTAEHFSTSAVSLGYTLAASTDKVSSVRYWNVTRQAVANLTSAQIRLYYGIGTSDGVTDYTNLTVVKNVGTGTTWVDVNGTATGNGSGSILSGSFNSFCDITIANKTGGTNTLPVELTNFEGRFDGSLVRLNWKTASELNNQEFSIERSKDGMEFRQLFTVAGAGTKKSASYYEAIDKQPLVGAAYYRLRQIDFDGQSTFSNVVKVEAHSLEDAQVKVFPNPASNGNFNVDLERFHPNAEVMISIIDLVGHVRSRTILKTNEAGYVTHSFHVEESGVLVILVSTEFGTTARKILID